MVFLTYFFEKRIVGDVDAVFIHICFVAEDFAFFHYKNKSENNFQTTKLCIF